MGNWFNVHRAAAQVTCTQNCMVCVQVFAWTGEQPPDRNRPLDAYYDDNLGRLMTYSMEVNKQSYFLTITLKELAFSELAHTHTHTQTCMNFGYFSHNLSVALIIFYLLANFTQILLITLKYSTQKSDIKRSGPSGSLLDINVCWTKQIDWESVKLFYWLVFRRISSQKDVRLL